MGGAPARPAAAKNDGLGLGDLGLAARVLAAGRDGACGGMPDTLMLSATAGAADGVSRFGVGRALLVAGMPTPSRSIENASSIGPLIKPLAAATSAPGIGGGAVEVGEKKEKGGRTKRHDTGLKKGQEGELQDRRPNKEGQEGELQGRRCRRTVC